MIGAQLGATVIEDLITSLEGASDAEDGVVDIPELG